MRPFCTTARLAAAVLGVGLFSLPALAQNQQQQRERPGQQSDRQERREVNVESSARWEHKKVNPDQLPGEVSRAVRAQMSANDKITHASSHTRGNRTLYRVDVATGPDRSRAYTVDSTGKVIDTDNTTEEGKVVTDFNTLPGEVKSTINKEAEGKPVKKVVQVTKDDDTFFVAQIQADQGVRSVRVGKNGDLLVEPRLMSERGNRDDARDANRDRDNRPGADRDRRADDQYAGWQRKTTTRDNLPGPVKQALGQEAKQDPVQNVVELSRDGKRVFQAEIVAAGGARTRTVRIDESGQIMREQNTTEPGRDTVSYETLPGPVKSTISKMMSGNQPKEVRQITRGGDTFYMVEHEGKRHYIGKNGEQLTEEQFRSNR